MIIATISNDALSLLFVVAISAFCFVRFLSLRVKLLCEVKKNMPNKYNQLLSLNKDFFKFIKSDKDTGNSKIDALKIKVCNSIKIAFLFLVILFVFFTALMINQFI